MRDLLSATTLAQALVNPHPLVTLNDTDTLSVALDLFATHRILSAPVLRATDHKIIGIVDNLDTLRKIAEYLNVANEFESLRNIKLETISLDVPVQSLIDSSKGDAFLAVDAASSIESVLKFFAGGLAHRCIVHLPQDEAKGESAKSVVFSQSDMARFLAKYANSTTELNSFFSKKVLDVIAKNRDMVLIHSDKTVWEAVQLLQEKQVSALAVVNADGKLVANFSASDLRGLKFSDFPSLLQSLDKFLPASSKNPKVVMEDVSLSHVLFSLSDNKIHRVWLVDSDKKPLGVISLTDILKGVYNN